MPTSEQLRDINDKVYSVDPTVKDHGKQATVGYTFKSGVTRYKVVATQAPEHNDSGIETNPFVGMAVAPQKTTKLRGAMNSVEFHGASKLSSFYVSKLY